METIRVQGLFLNAIKHSQRVRIDNIANFGGGEFLDGESERLPAVFVTTKNPTPSKGLIEYCRRISKKKKKKEEEEKELHH